LAGQPLPPNQQQQQQGPPSMGGPPTTNGSSAGSINAANAAHKIHELTERAIKSPPSGVGGVQLTPSSGGANKMLIDSVNRHSSPSGSANNKSMHGSPAPHPASLAASPHQYLPPSGSPFGGPKPLLRP